jgi:hypothetical protein
MGSRETKGVIHCRSANTIACPFEIQETGLDIELGRKRGSMGRLIWNGRPRRSKGRGG